MKLSLMYDNYVNDLILYNSPGYVSFVKKQQIAILKIFSDVDSSTITESSIKNFIISARTFYSCNTINKHISYLKRLYKFNNIDCSFKSIKKLKEEFITFGTCANNPKDILNNVLSTLSLQNKIAILLFYDTGVRLNELVNIKVSNVDLNQRTIYLSTTKTNRPRTVYFSISTRKLLKKHVQSVSSSWLFPSKNKDNHIKIHAIESLFARIRNRCKLKAFSPHRLRHSLSTELYKNGCDLMLISSILGHSNVNTTKRYIHSDYETNIKKYDKYHK